MLDTRDKTFLRSCKFGPKNPYCPIFRLGSVVSWTGSNFREMAVQVGGVRSALLGTGGGGVGSAGRRGCGPRALPVSGRAVLHSQLCCTLRGTLPPAVCAQTLGISG